MGTTCVKGSRHMLSFAALCLARCVLLQRPCPPPPGFILKNLHTGSARCLNCLLAELFLLVRSCSAGILEMFPRNS